jgi:hypothetical protein
VKALFILSETFGTSFFSLLAYDPGPGKLFNCYVRTLSCVPLKGAGLEKDKKIMKKLTHPSYDRIATYFIDHKFQVPHFLA